MNRLHSSLLPFLAATACLPGIASAQTTIPADNAAYAANSAGTDYLVAADDTRSINSGGGVVITLGGATGPFNLTVDGTVRHAGTNRAIRGTSNNVVFNLTVGSTGLVQAYADDAVQAQTGTFNVTNSGTIYGGTNIGVNPTAPVATGQALDLTSATGGTVINNLSGVLRADGHDAVRLGSNMTFTNYGTVLGNSVVNDSSANNSLNSSGNTSIAEAFSTSEGVSFEGGANSVLDNYGSISGSRHGVESSEAASNVTITNRAAGTIIGRNGSGIGFDSTGTAATNVVIHNYGLVRGDYAGVGNIIDRTGLASTTNDGDGDGIDIDGAATINNYAGGQIISTGAGGFDTSGRANGSEGVSIGGGVIVNSGLIQGADRGIVVNNDANNDRSGVAATSITNNVGGEIVGENGFAIRLENKGIGSRDDTIINAGTITGNGSIPDPTAIVTIQNGTVDTHSTGTLDGVIYTGTGLARFIRGDGAAIQMGEGDDVLTNTGTITGNTGRAVNMEGGDDTVNFASGAITGSINGGAGNDTLNVGPSVSTASAIQSFETVGVVTGTATLSGVVTGTTLNKTGAGSLVLSGNNAGTLTGLVTVEAGTLRVNNTEGSATGSGDVLVNAGATFAGGGSVSGNVTLDGILAPGNSIGELTVGGDVTWNGTTANAWNFELGLGDVSDQLLVGGDFLKGTGADFVFDFQSGATTGTFVLVTWDGTTDFANTDFSYTNLGGGLSGEFAINGNQLEFTTTAVPEPSTYAALVGAGVLGLALWCRRNRVVRA